MKFRFPVILSLDSIPPDERRIKAKADPSSIINLYLKVYEFP